MARRIVIQPNGKLAMFSEIVDAFVAYDMTREEAVRECQCSPFGGMTDAEAEAKVQRGIDAPGRWKEALEIIRDIHGEERLREILEEMGLTGEVA